MGRVDETGEHEGWVALGVADGAYSGTNNGTGGVVHDTDTRSATIRPYADITYWQARCDCGGWVGPVVPVPDDTDRWREPSEAQEDALLEPWSEHAALAGVLAGARTLARQITGLQ